MTQDTGASQRVLSTKCAATAARRGFSELSRCERGQLDSDRDIIKDINAADESR